MDAQQRIAELEAELAAKDARIGELETRVVEQTARIEGLTKQVAELLQKLNQNSRNSHLPPSSDGPGLDRAGRARRSPVKSAVDSVAIAAIIGSSLPLSTSMSSSSSIPRSA